MTAPLMTAGNRDPRETPERWSHPGWLLLLCLPPLLAGIYQGPAMIDDAYITFRYVENLVAGRGFVYNDSPVLGATAPAYVLLLALLRLLSVPTPAAAYMVGVLSAMLCPALVWRTGKALDRPGAGLLGGLLLALFPSWWLNGKTGMETTLAGALAGGLVLLDLKKRPVAAGLVAGLLALTRPDAALLPAVVFLLRLREDRGAALKFFAAALAVTLPWVIFATACFGSPVPQSLLAKRLIHPYPLGPGLLKLGGWFASITAEPRLMALMSVAFGAGAVWIAAREPRARALALWPPLFLFGLAATGVGSFFWYKYPVLPAYFLVAALGLDQNLRNIERRASPRLRLEKLILYLIPAAFIGAQLWGAGLWFAQDAQKKFVAKETALFEMGAEMRRLQPAGRTPVVFAGETGVLGYDLPSWEIVDSAGINSKEIFELRRADWERLRAGNPRAGWKEQWWGTPDWVWQALDRYRPDFIASNVSYLHLRTLGADPRFTRRYELVRSWQVPEVGTLALFARRQEK